MRLLTQMMRVSWYSCYTGGNMLSNNAFQRLLFLARHMDEYYLPNRENTNNE